jgi:hypothetical protein
MKEKARPGVLQRQAERVDKTLGFLQRVPGLQSLLTWVVVRAITSMTLSWCLPVMATYKIAHRAIAWAPTIAATITFVCRESFYISRGMYHLYKRFRDTKPHEH